MANRGYGPRDALQSPRFSGVRTFMRLPLVTPLPPAHAEHPIDVAVIGTPFDTGGTYRVGCRFGPSALRDASALLRPYNPALDVEIFRHLSVVDGGDIDVAPGFIEDSYARIADGLLPILQAGITPILLGGDHSISLAHLRAVARHHGPVALVQFDSHSDTWDAYFGHKYTHGTPFRRAIEEGLLDVGRSIQVGMRGSGYDASDYQVAHDLGLDLVSTPEVRTAGLPAIIERIRQRVGQGPVFLTFDIDFLDPAYAPGTGTPEVGGYTTWEAQVLLRGLTGMNFVGFDLVEVLPAYDHGQITALAGANMVYEFLSLLAWQRAH